MRRVRRRHARDGDGGLAHKLRARASDRKTPEAARARVPAWCRARHAGSGPTLPQRQGRAGSAKKSRVHIFWQRRIVAGDTTTPYWFPSQTGSGAIREDRLVLPIPPATHWQDAKPVILPAPAANTDEPKRLPTPRQKKSPKLRAIEPAVITAGGLRLVAPDEVAPVPKPKPEPKPKVTGPAFGSEAQAPGERSRRKNDPRHVAAARELRDRWLEQVNATPLVTQAKYDVSRQLGVAPSALTQAPRLEAA
jgi:hypothetical protein